MAFYLLLLIGIVLIAFNYNAIRKEKKSFNSILNHEVNNMHEYKVLIAEAKKEFADIILELQKEIEEINEKVKLPLEINKKNDEILVEKVEICDKIEDNNKKITRTKGNKVIDNNIKIDEVKDLLKQGLTVEDIAKKINIGKGEVLLIKELYLK